MNIPRFWERAAGYARTPAQKDVEITAWGWSHDNVAEARQKAQQRLARIIARATSGHLVGKRYPYSEQAALREEIVEEVADARDKPLALITRNSYGSLVLNVDSVMFVDIDLPAPRPFEWFRRLFRHDSGSDVDTTTMARINKVLRGLTSETFRIYRTAAGYRVIATSRTFEAGAPDAEAIMLALDADPSFVKLCRVQRSFRARLSAKPWRCGSRLPPSRYPRTAEQTRHFEKWLRGYEEKSRHTAVCRYIGQVGSARTSQAVGPLLRLHDEFTKAHSDLPLA